MATYVSYSPGTTIAKALFNFDATGYDNFKYSGTIRVSLSDAFTSADYSASPFWSELYTFGSNETAWTAQIQANIQEILQIFTQFVNVSFDWKGHFDNSPGSDSTPNPEDVGLAGLSDINISRIYRSDVDFGGVSGIDSDGSFEYVGGAGDIFINDYGFGDLSFGIDTEIRETLMHELGHSLGLYHPHLPGGALTADFTATRSVGFAQLGFHTSTGQDMDKEYFTIMSYDDQPYRAHTPMILDVIALQQAYGEGSGTTGSGNDTIVAGTYGYRTYFDTGGTDTINLSVYEEDTYLQMGVQITGASHLVGVAMGAADASRTFAGNDPFSLRWFYGEYENADGSTHSDRIYGTEFANSMEGRAAADSLFGLSGNDTLSGGDGGDLLWGGIGNDVAYGDGGNDLLDGQDGNDVLNGGDGADVVEARLGADALYGDAGDDTLSGGGYADAVRGGSGNDVLYGDGGGDLLVGGTGVDLLTGGLAQDRFDFDAMDGSTDSITDFANGAGGDILDLRDVLVGYDGNVDNFVRLENGGSTVIVTVNADGLGGDYLSVVSLQGMTLTGTLLNDMLANGNLVV